MTDGLTKAASGCWYRHQVFTGLIRSGGDNGEWPMSPMGMLRRGHRCADPHSALALYNREGKAAGISLESAKDLRAAPGPAWSPCADDRPGRGSRALASAAEVARPLPTPDALPGGLRVCPNHLPHPGQEVIQCIRRPLPTSSPDNRLRVRDLPVRERPVNRIHQVRRFSPAPSSWLASCSSADASAGAAASGALRGPGRPGPCDRAEPPPSRALAQPRLRVKAALEIGRRPDG